MIKDLRLDRRRHRPDHADRRGDGQGGAARRQGAARLRRPAAQGADALRQEHGVPRRRDRPARARPRHPRRGRQHLDDVRPDATASGSGGSSASIRGRSSSTSTASRRASGSTADVDRLTYRELQAAPRADPEAHARPRRGRPRLDGAADSVAAVRLVIARCSVDYAGRLDAHLPEATRLIMVKADGCVAIHADGGAYKPLNWMNAPNTLVDARRPVGRDEPEGRDADDHPARGVQRRRPRARRRSRAAEGRRRGPPPGAAGGQPARHRGRPDARAPRVPDGDRPDRPGVPRRQRHGGRHRGQATRRDRRRRAARPLHRAAPPRFVAR